MRRRDRLVTLLRRAEDLEHSRDQSVHAARVDASDGTVRLCPKSDGEVSVARWAAERELELFRRAFGRKLRVGEAQP